MVYNSRLKFSLSHMEPLLGCHSASRCSTYYGLCCLGVPFLESGWFSSSWNIGAQVNQSIGKERLAQPHQDQLISLLAAFMSRLVVSLRVRYPECPCGVLLFSTGHRHAFELLGARRGQIGAKRCFTPCHSPRQLENRKLLTVEDDGYSRQ